MKQIKLRELSRAGNSIALGVTIPTHIAQKYEGTYFHIFEQNGCIVLVSGCVNSEVKRNEIMRRRF